MFSANNIHLIYVEMMSTAEVGWIDFGCNPTFF